ncbi:MAG: hypothetical protein PVH61_32640 [Candidatus Aminicenantes bacterium]|jgi:hypothetical protein
MAKFEAKEKELYIDGQKVIKGYESFTGWFWFATEEAYKQDSILPDGKEVKDDIIYFGFVQGQEQEWGYFSKGELESLNPKIWELPKKDLPYSGRRG